MATATERLTALLSGRYTIERELGAGGMATVYLAHDVKHDRKVALKVLRPELAAVIGGERFLQEIKLTANLQHPNILPLYDSGEVDSLLYYVMPYVEGETLRDRLDREKQFAVDQTVEIAKDVAAALQYAHEHGVVHRDIKPENILFQSGKAVVADFGIALAVSHAGGPRLTETGLSLGTPHYMSPEQATGDRELDARSDIYSLGAMIYEMLAGDPPHLGSTVQAVVAQILTEEPRALTTRRRTVPRNVEAAIHRALQKLPADRFTSAKEFAEALVNPAFGAAAAKRAGSDWRGRVAIPALAGSVVLAVVAVVGWMHRPVESPSPVVRFTVPPPTTETINFSTFAVSPDGNTIVWSAYVASSNRAALWVRRLGDTALTRLETPGAIAVFPSFSPTGDELAFASTAGPNARASLQIIPIQGGPARTLVDSVDGFLSWGSDGYVYFSRQSRLKRIPATGGAVEDLSSASDSAGPRPVNSIPLPSGRGVLGAVGDSIRVLDLGAHEWRALVAGGPWMAYDQSGYLLYAEGRFLMAAPFDPQALTLTSPPTSVVEVTSGDFGAFAIGGGTLIYRATAGASGMTLALEDRNGMLRQLPNLPDGQRFGYPAASPDGRKIAVMVAPIGADVSAKDVWVYELPNGPLTRLTFEGEDDDPTWTPDGRRILYDSDLGREDGKQALYITNWDGSGSPELVLAHEGRDIWRTSWLPDGKRFVFYEDRDNNEDIYMGRLGTPDSVIPLVTGPFNESWPVVSPDGRWLAYNSNESGRLEVYVRPLQGQGTRRQVSRQGGSEPAWSHSGRELFFVGVGTDSLYVARLDIGTDIAVRDVRSLFRMPITGSGYAVLPGDSLFVVMEPLQLRADAVQEQPAVTVLNFDRELKERFGR